MDVVNKFLEARRQGRAEDAIELIGTNASISFPWGGLRSGDAVKKYIRDERSFIHKEYLSSQVEVREICEGTYQRHYRWDKGQQEFQNSGMDLWNRFIGGAQLPLYREVYFVRDGKIAHVITNKDPSTRNLYHLFSHCLNPWAKKPIVLFQNTRL